MWDDHQNPINEDTDEFVEIGVKSQSHHQSQMHSDYDSAESIVDSDVEDGQLRKMLASPLYIQCREENSEPSRAPTASGKLEAMVMQELDVKFISRAYSSWETWDNVFNFQTRWSIKLAKILELVKQEHHMGSLTSCIDELQQQAYAQRLELEDAHHGYIESRREQVRLQEEVSMKEKALWDAQMGKMKRAQELRVDEFSVEDMQEQKWNRITAGSCLTFPVDQWWFQVLVPCWAAPNACLLTHGIHRDDRKTFLVINFLHLIRLKIIIKEITIARHKERKNQCHKQ